MVAKILIFHKYADITPTEVFLVRSTWLLGTIRRIQNSGINMAAKIINFRELIDIIPAVVFWSADHDYEDKIRKFKIADPIWRPKYWFSINTTILHLQVFFGALSMISRSNSTNSKWQIQYGGQNIDPKVQ